MSFTLQCLKCLTALIVIGKLNAKMEDRKSWCPCCRRPVDGYELDFTMRVNPVHTRADAEESQRIHSEYRFALMRHRS